MLKAQSQNLERLKALISAHKSIHPLAVSVNVEKIQRIAVSLRKLYRGGERTEKIHKLERRANVLANELGIRIFFFRAPGEDPIQFNIGSEACSIF